MIVARPMGLIRWILFYTTFTVSRIPFWFIIVSSFFYQYISPTYGILLIILIFIFRSYIESEIAGSGFFIFSSLRLLRFFSFIFILIAVDLFIIYYSLFAEPIDKALISLALILMVYLFYDKEKITGYWNGYKTPYFTSLITTLLWMYMIFINDSTIGNLSILLAVYIIEFFNLINGTPIKGLEKIKK